MKTRLNMVKVQPDAYKALGSLEQFLGNTELTKIERELIKIRASQINGCAYCVNMHSKDARKYGETQQRLLLIGVWKEAANLFTDEEQLLFSITEEITLISQRGLSDELYEKAISVFGEIKTAQIIMEIATINLWNRIGVSLALHPAKDPQ